MGVFQPGVFQPNVFQGATAGPVTHNLSGTIAGTSTVAGVFALTFALAGTIAASSSVSGAVGHTVVLAGSVSTPSASLSGALTGLVDLGVGSIAPDGGATLATTDFSTGQTTADSGTFSVAAGKLILVAVRSARGSGSVVGTASCTIDPGGAAVALTKHAQAYDDTFTGIELWWGFAPSTLTNVIARIVANTGAASSGAIVLSVANAAASPLGASAQNYNGTPVLSIAVPGCAAGGFVLAFAVDKDGTLGNVTPYAGNVELFDRGSYLQSFADYAPTGSGGTVTAGSANGGTSGTVIVGWEILAGVTPISGQATLGGTFTTSQGPTTHTISGAEAAISAHADVAGVPYQTVGLAGAVSTPHADVAGALVYVWALSGTTSGTSTVTGAASLTKPLSGSPAGSSSVSGSFASTIPLAGGVAGAGAAAGAVTHTVALAGSPAGAGVVLGSPEHVVVLAGALGASGAASGALSKTAALSGAVAGTSSAAGAFSHTVVLSGAVQGAASLGGNVTGAATDLSGTIAGIGALSGPLDLTKVLGPYNFAGFGSVSGVLLRLVLPESLIYGTATLTSARALSEIPIGGAIAGAGSLAGAPQVTLVGDVAGAGSLAGEPEQVVALAGAVDGTCALDGTFTTAVVVLDGAVAGTSALTSVRLAYVVPLFGNPAGKVTLTGAPIRQRNLSGTVAGKGRVWQGIDPSETRGVGSLAGDFDYGWGWASVASGVATVAGALGVERPVSGSISGTSVVRGNFVNPFGSVSVGGSGAANGAPNVKPPVRPWVASVGAAAYHDTILTCPTPAQRANGDLLLMLTVTVAGSTSSLSTNGAPWKQIARINIPTSPTTQWQSQVTVYAAASTDVTAPPLVSKAGAIGGIRGQMIAVRSHVSGKSAILRQVGQWAPVPNLSPMVLPGLPLDTNGTVVAVIGGTYAVMAGPGNNGWPLSPGEQSAFGWINLYIQTYDTQQFGVVEGGLAAGTPVEVSFTRAAGTLSGPGASGLLLDVIVEGSAGKATLSGELLGAAKGKATLVGNTLRKLRGEDWAREPIVGRGSLAGRPRLASERPDLTAAVKGDVLAAKLRVSAPAAAVEGTLTARVNASTLAVKCNGGPLAVTHTTRTTR